MILTALRIITGNRPNGQPVTIQGPEVQTLYADPAFFTVESDVANLQQRWILRAPGIAAAAEDIEALEAAVATLTETVSGLAEQSAVDDLTNRVSALENAETPSIEDTWAASFTPNFTGRSTVWIKNGAATNMVIQAPTGCVHGHAYLLIVHGDTGFTATFDGPSWGGSGPPSTSGAANEIMFVEFRMGEAAPYILSYFVGTYIG